MPVFITYTRGVLVMKLQLLCVLVFVGVTPGALVAQEPSEIVSAFHSAIARHDTVEALSYLDANVIIFESGGAEMSRDEFESHHMGADMAYAATTTRETISSETKVAGEVAVVLNRTKTTGRVRDRDIDSTGVETVVLERKAGVWKIVHVHWSSRRQ